MYFVSYLLFLIIRLPPISTRTCTRFPDTPLFRSEMSVRAHPTGEEGVAAVADKDFLFRAHAADTERDPQVEQRRAGGDRQADRQDYHMVSRSEEHTSELQSLMRISYAVFCLKKKTNKNIKIESQRTNRHTLYTPQQMNTICTYHR